MSGCNHHPDDSTLMNYGAGSLPDSLALAIACHVTECEQCQRKVQEAEQIGLAFIEKEAGARMTERSRKELLAMLDEVEPLPAVEPPACQPVESDIPLPLQPMLGSRLDRLHWKTMAPGMKQFVLPVPLGTLRLLSIAPGTCMPVHGHSGSELTLVLKGSYSDELGRFCAGDLADLDPEVTHQPVADTHEGCICLIATDAPLRFKGLVPKLLQPFFQL